MLNTTSEGERSIFKRIFLLSDNHFQYSKLNLPEFGYFCYFKIKQVWRVN